VLEARSLPKGAHAAECMRVFDQAVILVETSKGGLGTDVAVVSIPAVGLKLGGKAGIYDLFYFPETKKSYAIDVKTGTAILSVLVSTLLQGTIN